MTQNRLLEFTVNNFLSFKEEVTFSLRARKAVTGHEKYNTFPVAGEPILKTVVRCDYFQGRYGAVPVIETFNLFSGESHGQKWIASPKVDIANLT